MKSYQKELQQRVKYQHKPSFSSTTKFHSSSHKVGCMAMHMHIIYPRQFIQIDKGQV